MTSVYCTIFDSNYLARALVLYSSLMRVNDDSIFAFYCIDDRSAELLNKMQLDRSMIVRHDDFATKELIEIQPLRSRGEYCWTCKPIVLLDLMDRIPGVDWVVYVDTDMMFFSDPDAELNGQNAHYVITPHRFHPAFTKFEKEAGKYNAGYAAVRRSNEGRQTIDWWKNQCLTSCSSVPTESTYADQKYLNSLLRYFPFGHSSNHKGINAAPWNIENYRISVAGDMVSVDDMQLILYHFQGLQLFDDGTASLYMGDRRLPDDIRSAIYMPYISEIIRAYSLIRKNIPEFRDGLIDKKLAHGGLVARTLRLIRMRRNFFRFENPLS